MFDLAAKVFSFKDLYSPDQSQNQRWVELAEVIDQLFDEFIYPELERNKNIKSFFTADSKDLEAINIDLYQDLFEQVVLSESNKRLALMIKKEILQEKNSYECIYLSLASLGLTRDAVTVVPLFSPIDKPYFPGSLITEPAFKEGQEYFITSKVEISLNKNLLFSSGRDITEMQNSIETIVKENVPEHIDIIISSHTTSYGSSASVASIGTMIKVTIQNIA